MAESIAAIVVTYNRLELLQETIESLLHQSRVPDEIIVINNSSTDGTLAWLESQTGISIVTQPNIGGAGGFATGMKHAFDKGYDWIWCMDDDVVPMKDCLEHLISFKSQSLIRAPYRFEADSNALPQDTLEFNFTNPFKSLWKRMFTTNDLHGESILAVGLTFEGPLIHRTVIEKIGLPEARFFIFADDSDFFIRAFMNGFNSIIIFSARMERKIPYVIRKSAPWKAYYELRNIILLDMRYGSFWVKLLRPIYYWYKSIIRAKDSATRKRLLRGFIDGITQKLE
ncbi:MAG: glycosyltransferase family 2 protein [Ignavibacteria bacterium]|nr:glycosyltransferase family 2 protein [Ignavibacteria bacterium]